MQKALGPIVLHLFSQDQAAPMRRISKAETYRRRRRERNNRNKPTAIAAPFPFSSVLSKGPLANPDKFWLVD
jgi:hypothetical protein